MPCTCAYLTEFALDCTPSIGGVSAVVFKGAGQPAEGSTTPTDVDVQTLPESSTYNAVMTYDKYSNVKYWTTTVTLNIGLLNAAAAALAENLPCPVGRTIELTMYSGHKVTISDAFIQTANFQPGTKKTDGAAGTLTFEAITKVAPTVADPDSI